jgi:hypothetical protein
VHTWSLVSVDSAQIDGEKGELYKILNSSFLMSNRDALHFAKNSVTLAIDVGLVHSIRRQAFVVMTLQSVTTQVEGITQPQHPRSAVKQVRAQGALHHFRVRVTKSLNLHFVFLSWGKEFKLFWDGSSAVAAYRMRIQFASRHPLTSFPRIADPFR